MVRLELWSGVRNDLERRGMERLDYTIPRLPIDDSTWHAAAAYASKARASGVTVPATDLLIFACAKAFGAAIIHVDRHFDMLEQLK